MKKFSKFICGSSGKSNKSEEEEQPQAAESPPSEPDEASELPPSDPNWKLPSHLPGLPNSKIVRCLKHNDAYSVKKARITPNGSSHRIVISFDKQADDKTIMTLIIDGSQCFSVNSQWSIRGETWLVIDGSNVNFSWDTIGLFMRFTFRTRLNIKNHGQTSGGAGGGGGYGGGDYDDASSVAEGSVCGDNWDPEFRGAEWEEKDQFYCLEIIGDNKGFRQ